MKIILALAFLLASVSEAGLLSFFSVQVPSGGLTDVQSIVLNGSQYVSIPSASISTSAFSIAAWVKTTDSAANVPIISKLTVTGAWSFNLSTSSDANGYLRFAISSDGQFGGASWNNLNGSTRVIADGNWHHIVGTFKGSTTTSTIFVDGNLEASDSSSQASIFTSVTPIIYGGFSSGGGATTIFPGNIDWVSIYSTALSGSDVSALYNAGHPNPSMATLPSFVNCTGWWPVGEGSDDASTIFDNKSTNNGTLVGSPSYSMSVP